MLPMHPCCPYSTENNRHWFAPFQSPFSGTVPIILLCILEDQTEETKGRYREITSAVAREVVISIPWFLAQCQGHQIHVSLCCSTQSRTFQQRLMWRGRCRLHGWGSCFAGQKRLPCCTVPTLPRWLHPCPNAGQEEHLGSRLRHYLLSAQLLARWWRDYYGIG